jgi:ABC-type multidrug transport system fused ATPase/permease subunit
VNISGTSPRYHIQLCFNPDFCFLTSFHASFSSWFKFLILRICIFFSAFSAVQFFCVLVPIFVVADEEGGANTKKGELQQKNEQQKEQREQKLDEMKKEQEEVKEEREQKREAEKEQKKKLQEERKQKRNELKERDEKAREDKKQKRDELKNVGKDTEE